jgi:hypothetical protein
MSPTTLSTLLKIKKSTDSNVIGQQKKKMCPINNEEVDKTEHGWVLDT